MRILLLDGVVLSLAAVTQAPAQDPPAPVATFSEMTEAQSKAIERGLEWLAARQNKDGGWGGNAPVATAAIAGMAFLAGGHAPGRSKYGDNVRRVITFLLSRRYKSGRARGYINEGAARGAGGSGMHGHGY